MYALLLPTPLEIGVDLLTVPPAPNDDDLGSLLNPESNRPMEILNNLQYNLEAGGNPD